ncbi:Fic family protein [Dysgonomonas sp. 25]|uniref:Fic family protein n=1 Tax=Dysgonomonas sp. 25 TaxID=2302933 RepID=UPI0013D6B703|nr:Fic family protein [Dysgonomonas sp. 25]NDV69501.1 Fic family protein [Dysgonomonas sp. 25]
MAYIPPYQITPRIIDLVSQISEAIGSFYGQEDLRLHRVNRIKTIQGSLAIEGNTLTTDQITAILEGKPVIAPINEVQEVRNAIKAYQLLDELNPYCVDDLLKVHLAMEAGLIDDAGHFRAKGVGVASGDDIIHYAPPAERVPQLIQDLFDWLSRTDEHPLIKSCVFHYEFEFIHPFSDGNGRTGRLWQTLILSRWRAIFKDLPIENIVYKYRKEYYEAIAISGGESGCTPFIEFILEVINETLAMEKAIPHTTRDRILAQMRNNPKITRNELAAILNLTADGIKYHLQKMTKEGLIIHRGSPRNGYWEVVNDLP